MKHQPAHVVSIHDVCWPTAAAHTTAVQHRRGIVEPGNPTFTATLPYTDDLLSRRRSTASTSQQEHRTSKARPPDLPLAASLPASFFPTPGRKLVLRLPYLAAIEPVNEKPKRCEAEMPSLRIYLSVASTTHIYLAFKTHRTAMHHPKYQPSRELSSKCPQSTVHSPRIVLIFLQSTRATSPVSGVAGSSLSRRWRARGKTHAALQLIRSSDPTDTARSWSCTMWQRA